MEIADLIAASILIEGTDTRINPDCKGKSKDEKDKEDKSKDEKTKSKE